VSFSYPADTLVQDREAILTTYFTDRHTYAWAHVFKRAIYARQAQPIFPPGRSYEDVAAVPGLLADCASLYRLARPIIDYRQHASSMKNAVSAKWCVDYVAALQHVKHVIGQRPTSEQVRMQADICACHFYVGMVKSSFQLPWREGNAVRVRVNRMFAEGLFHAPDRVLAAMTRGELASRDRKADRVVAAQVRKALSGNLFFSLGKTLSRKLKQWQRVLATA
jgi:hypothetical protein